MQHPASNVALLRSNKRLRAAVVALSIAVVALGAYTVVSALSQKSSSSSSSAAATSKPSEHPTIPGTATGQARPSLLVGVTVGGTLETLDPSNGQPVRTLATGATGDELSVSPNGSVVYFESPVGCLHEIQSVSTAGGAAQNVVAGSVPAISPDGSKLAYVRQPFAAGASCSSEPSSATSYVLVVRELSSGLETTYPISPQISGGAPDPIDHLSWSFDSKVLAVSVNSTANDGKRYVSIVDPATGDYYFDGSGVPVTGPQSATSYYREGVFMPDGNLFVDRVCCSGGQGTVSSNLLQEVTPSTGAVTRLVAIGITANDHTSLDTDVSGRWLLYLSANQLYVSDNGSRPTELVSGLLAAAW